MTPDSLPVARYEELLSEKTDRLKTMMSPFNAPIPRVFASPKTHYRMRTEFRIWHEGEDIYHIMFNPETRQRLRIDTFPTASQLINKAMQETISLIKTQPILRKKLFQIDYLSTLHGEIAISLIYHKKLDDEWKEQASKLREQLHQRGIPAQLIGRAFKTKISLDHDFVEERLSVDGEVIVYRQVENSFTQPNAAVNVHMLEWALDVTKNSQGDLLELYCGNGNFTLALARNFNRVLATEITKSSVASAQYNIAVNQIQNVQIIRMSAEEFTQAMQGVREFNRLKDIDLNSYHCNTIFVDPPRSGLDEETLKLVQGYSRILYISCNPETLCSNLETLKATHAIEQLALFDQFPYTHHIECGVLLTRR